MSFWDSVRPAHFKMFDFVFSEQTIPCLCADTQGFPYLYDPFKQELVEIKYAQAEQAEDLQPNFI